MKANSTNLTVDRALVDRCRTIIAKLTPPPSLASFVSILLDQTLRQIEDQKPSPILPFVAQCRQMLSQPPLDPVTATESNLLLRLEERLEALEQQLSAGSSSPVSYKSAKRKPRS